jgi:hypothetical protein
LYVE